MTACAILITIGLSTTSGEAQTMNPRLLSQPQLTTTSRLLKLGESITFRLHVPEGADAGDLEIFPRYLERAKPGQRFVAGGDLDWLDAIPSETLPIDSSELTYVPNKPGSYLARWRVGGETLYRYFSAIEDDSIVLRFSAFEGLEAEPTLHATGIPLDYRLPADQFTMDDPLCAKLVGYHRCFGDTVIPWLPDTPELTRDERLATYGAMLERARALLPDPSDARSARIDMRHGVDPGYTDALAELGVNDHCGLNEANAPPWLGMPEFPYFASPVDCRKANQAEGGAVVAHQWDFCGGWHFIGPVSWHYKAAAGDWDVAERCVREGVEELQLLAEMSGHAAFAVPLYDGLVGPGYPNPAFEYAVRDPRNFRGDVKQVLIMERALDEGEIAEVMNGDVLAVDDALAAWAFGDGISLDGEDDRLVMDAPVEVRSRDFTVACWVRPGASQRSWANIISSHSSDGVEGYRGLSIEQDGHSTNRFYLIAGDRDHWVGTDVATQLAAGEWQHFAVVRDGNTLTHYLNGVVSATGEVPEHAFSPATDAFRVGDWARGEGSDEPDMLRFVEQYQRLIAFELPKRHKVVFARSIDTADYYRRHYERTPRTVFVSQTDHVQHDKWWLCTWCGEGLLVPRDRIPWETRISSVMADRRRKPPLKDPLSCEYILVEDHRRSIRFERESPNPIWWSDYTVQERGPLGSTITHIETPDVDVRRSGWDRQGREMTMRLTMRTEAEFADYAIALWGLPNDVGPDAEIRTNATEHILARNRAGECHLVLVFDLKPNAEITVTLSRR